MKALCTAVFLFGFFLLPGQEAAKRQFHAIRTTEHIRIDGIPDEPAWGASEVATDFTQSEPTPGAKPSRETEVRILYDDRAIYVAARMHEDPEAISAQLFERDNLDDDVETDWFGIAFDTYKDGINGYAFLVTPAGVQIDLKFIASGEDDSWDAVWDSKVSIDSGGWFVEMEIPYSALRFSDQDEQSWHLQIGRSRFVSKEEIFWNPVNPEVSGFFTQAGIIYGLRGIQSPVRLSATPFLAYYVEHAHDKSAKPVNDWGHRLNGGMDLRYGLSDGFTLDMTLIPDFGQVRSDNEVLNLSPDEVRFDENRQFFTEGTELFSKAGIFYSRRIGGTPFYADDIASQLGEGQTIIENPQEAQLYNATKLSGRTRGGTGIGFFNAIEGKEHAVIRRENGRERLIQTNPLTNYNVMVIDQNLKNNSYVALINTNVWRSGRAYEANVTGTEFSIRDKTNTYVIRGHGVLTQKYFSESTDLGFRHEIEIAKQSGNLTAGVLHHVESDTYDPNDLGFDSRNNVRRFNGFIRYNVYEPFGAWQRMGVGFEPDISFLYKLTGPEEFQVRKSLFTGYGCSISWYGVTRNYLALNAAISIGPGKRYTYFESHVDGRIAYFPSYYGLDLDIATDSRKRLSLKAEFDANVRGEKKKNRQQIEIEPLYRISDRLSLLYNMHAAISRNDAGYITHDTPADIVFGKRDITNVVNRLEVKYTFNTRMNCHFRLRHNWTRVAYNSFYALLLDGGEGPTDYSANEDVNFNAFTIDAVFRWRFAPGSDIYLVWKNSVFGEDDNADLNFWENLERLGDLPQSNSFSIKVLYYLDYQKVRGR